MAASPPRASTPALLSGLLLLRPAPPDPKDPFRARSGLCPLSTCIRFDALPDPFPGRIAKPRPAYRQLHVIHFAIHTANRGHNRPSAMAQPWRSHPGWRRCRAFGRYVPPIDGYVVVPGIPASLLQDRNIQLSPRMSTGYTATTAARWRATGQSHPGWPGPGLPPHGIHLPTPGSMEI